MARSGRIALQWLFAGVVLAQGVSLQAGGPDDAEAAAFLARWLTARGYEPPPLIVTNEGIPDGAGAATMCSSGACVIRVRPDALRSRIADRNALGSSWRQWQNLLLHEAVHYIDIKQRGRSDHGREFWTKARSLGVAYDPFINPRDGRP